LPHFSCSIPAKLVGEDDSEDQKMAVDDVETTSAAAPSEVSALPAGNCSTVTSDDLTAPFQIELCDWSSYDNKL
jgi:hypothetical protein